LSARDCAELLSCPSQWEKVACGAFSDIGFVSAGKRRDFCRLRRA
jgi:hypothetical protein